MKLDKYKDEIVGLYTQGYSAFKLAEYYQCSKCDQFLLNFLWKRHKSGGDND